MKLATLFTTVTLLTTLSCLPNYIASCSKHKEIPPKRDQAQPIQEPENDNPITKTEADWNESNKKLNILILTIPAPGHTAVPLALGEELARRGHSVTFSTSGNRSQEAAEKVGVTFKSTGANDSFSKMITQFKKEKKITEFLFDILPTLFGIMESEITHFTDMIIAETNSGTKWDIIMSTDFLMTLLPCLASYMNIPAILIGTSGQVYPHTYPPWSWPSSVGGFSNEEMTFLERVAHTFERMLLPTFLSFILFSPAKTSIAKVCPGLSNLELSNAPAVYLPNIVPTAIGFEFSRTMTPLTHYVGPIQSEHPAPLTPELETWFANKQDKSVIYISMGSLLFVPEKMADALVNGILKTNYSVVWALRKKGEYELNIDNDRFFVSKWLPQLSVLRHRAISMAILHGGANGVHESLISGVPVIALPEMTEQKANAGRVHHHKLGLHLDKQGLTADQVYKSITKIEAGDYRENVRQLQKVFRAAGGVKRAGDLVEFYSEVGYDHLVPAYAKYHWSWVQYYNVDVYILLLACVLCVVYVDYRLLRCFCSRCCTKKLKTE